MLVKWFSGKADLIMATRDDILRKLDISPTDWVLEIGGGPTPFVRSDILADKFLSDNTHRSEPLLVDRPTVICDAHYLPFLDDSFDYVFCSQILEHLKNPELFFQEIARVGRKGYIETPNEIRERLFGWPFHKWIVDRDDHGLVLRQNDVEQAFGLFFHRLQLENYEFAKFCSTSHDLLNICYEWHEKPSFRFAEAGEYKLPNEKVCIEDGSQFVLSEPYDKRLSEKIDILKWVKKHIPKKLKQSIKRVTSPPYYGYRHSYEEAQSYLSKILACPVCKVKVIENESRVICPKCGRHFDIKNSIVFMLND